MNKDAIRPGALAAGAVTLLVMAALYNRESNRCKQFDGLWKDSGPIHIQQHIQDEAFAHAAMKLRSVDAAGKSMDVFELRDYLLNYFEPKCKWSEMESDRGKRIMQSFEDIARYAKDNFTKGSTPAAP